MLKNNKVTCVRLVSSMQPLNAKKHRARVTIGEELLQCEFSASTMPTSLAAVKNYLNSMISTKNSMHLTLHSKHYCYSTPMDEDEHARFHLPLKPPEIIKQFNLQAMAVNYRIYYEIHKIMPGL